MENNYKFEIISPEKIIFSDNCNMITLPSYEGDMSILKNHISIIAFLRPGIIKATKDENNFEEFFVQEGIAEYFNDSLVVLSTSIINIKNISKDFLDNIHRIANEKLADKNITDHDRYMLNHKLDVIKEIRV